MLLLLGISVIICILVLIDIVIEEKITIFENSGKRNELINWFINTYKSIRNSWWVFLLAYIAYIGWDTLWPIFSLILFITFIVIYGDYKKGIVNKNFIRIVDSVGYLLPYLIALYTIYVINFQ